MEPILECRQLFKDYTSCRALAGVDLTLYRGKIVGLLGPNGSGKTTLIKLAAGLLAPTAGEILVAGHTPGPETKALVSYLPERTYLPDWMTARQVIGFFADFYTDFDSAAAFDMLQRLGVLADAKLKTLSKGTKEKVQLILVMSRRAQLYLLDEPIGGVDPAAREYILSTILTNYNANATVLISTHLISDIEKVLDQVVFLHAGQVDLCATVDDIRAERGCSVDTFFREVFKC